MLGAVGCTGAAVIMRESCAAADAWRIEFYSYNLRPWSSPFGVVIRTVIDHGYRLHREPSGP